MANFIITANGQSLPDPTLNNNFNAQVKSVEEFIDRFNGIEDNPIIKHDNNRRRNNIIALFDYKINHEGLSKEDFKSKLTNFVSVVTNDSVYINITDEKTLAIASCHIVFEGKRYPITLVLQSEIYKSDRVRWAIVGVRGLSNIGIFDKNKLYPISPVEHEIHFMSLDNVFTHNQMGIFGYRGKSVEISEISVFLTMARFGKFQFDSVDNLSICFLGVPDYVFIINEKPHNRTNSGWVITQLLSIKENQKTNYIKNILGYENSK